MLFVFASPFCLVLAIFLGVTAADELAECVAVGRGESIVAALSAFDWKAVDTSKIPLRSAMAVAFSQPAQLYLVVGTNEGNDVVSARSRDGLSWEEGGTLSSLSSARTVAYSVRLKTWFAAGDGIMSSESGIDWERVDAATSELKTVNTMACSRKRCVGAGSGAQVFIYSDDGVRWSYGENPVLTVANSVCYSALTQHWVAAGMGTEASIVFSEDEGRTWRQADYNAPEALELFAVAHSDSEKTWIAVGLIGGEPGMMISNDGRSWKRLNAPSVLDRVVTGIAALVLGSDTDVWWAVGESTSGMSSIFSKDSGRTWEAAMTSPFESASAVVCNTIKASVIVAPGDTVVQGVFTGGLTLLPGASFVSSAALNTSTVAGNLTIGVNSTLVISGISSSGTYEVFVANGIVGSFSSVTVTASEPCKYVTFDTSYTSSTISVTVQLDNIPSCSVDSPDSSGTQSNDGSLSVAALVGIIVACAAAVGTAIIIFVYVIYRRRRQKAAFSRMEANLAAFRSTASSG